MIVLDPIMPMAYVVTLAVVASIFTIWTYWQVGDRLRPWQNLLLLVPRLLAVLAVLAVLLQPSRRDEIPEAKLDSVLLVGVDNSGSMAQEDTERGTRLALAKSAVTDELLANLEPVEAGGQRAELYVFADDALTTTAAALEEVDVVDGATQFHRSISTMLDNLGPDEIPSALVLLTDGHDHELISPARTAVRARARHLPIYAVVTGAKGKVRDLSVSISNFQHYGYVDQAFRIDASLRQIGCEFEDVVIELKREGQVVKSVNRSLGEAREIGVGFEVREAEPGQYEYEVVVRPLADEADLANNVTVTYVNVIDQQIRVLMLEGEPHWDTTFLRRALFHNDKFNVDAIIQFRPDKARALRSELLEELTVPRSLAELADYDVVILGRAIERILDEEGRDALAAYVGEHGGCLVFARGNAFAEIGEESLAPVLWDEDGHDEVAIAPTREGGRVGALALVAARGPDSDNPLPEPMNVRKVASRKSLSSTLANAKDLGEQLEMPAIVHRRQGRGQVLSIGVDGLWRWAFNEGVSEEDNLYDRFWDNLVLWVLAGADYMPSRKYSFRANTANVALGGKIYFRLGIRTPEGIGEEMPLELFRGGEALGTLQLGARDGGGWSRLTAAYEPPQTGRYLARVKLPDETIQEVKFMVYEDNREQTEVAVDREYLAALCQATGGRLLASSDLADLPATLMREQTEAKAKVRLTTLWDQVWIFYLIVLAFAIDWYWRRKWGLC